MYRTSTIINRIYNSVHESNVTSCMYHDEAWQGVSILKSIVDETLSQVGLLDSRLFDSYLHVEGTGYRTNNDGQQWKEYVLEIWEGKKHLITGIITCSQAGTVENPWSAYDINLIMFDSPKKD